MGFLKFEVTLTWSKIMAAVVAIMSFILDLMGIGEGHVFMFALPFVVFLITGKQINDRLKLKHEVQ